MLSKMLRKFGYVTRAELQCVQSANWLLKQGIESGSRIIDNLRYRLQESEAEVEISRNLLTKCAEVRDQLREELSIVTTERDIAQGKVEEAQYDAHALAEQVDLLEGQLAGPCHRCPARAA